jgi:hypothetical protein
MAGLVPLLDERVVVADAGLDEQVDVDEALDGPW